MYQKVFCLDALKDDERAVVKSKHIHLLITFSAYEITITKVKTTSTKIHL